MQRLNRKATNTQSKRPLKVMQFGGGNFLRAFVNWMIEVLNKETDFNGGIAIIKPTAGGDYAELKAQDGLFTVVLDGIQDGKLIAEKKLITSVQEVVNSYSEWQGYLEIAKNPYVRFIVSNTTESGIKFNANDKYDDSPPQEFPAKLTIWLHHRFLYFNGEISKGCILLPCELIEDNGIALRHTILQYADHWQLEDAFKNWIATANNFCNTLVDRIVSGYPRDRADTIQEELGYEDQLLVAGEYYHSWVIKADEIVQKELPFAETDLNVVFVNDLVAHREMKVRILNGAHTALVPVAYLAGIRFVREAMEHKEVSRFVALLLLEEASKTLDFPDKVKRKFVADVLDRFRNPLLKHQLISISLNSTSKFVTRLLPTLKDYATITGELPKRIVFGLSALIRFYKGEYAGEKIALKDSTEILDFFEVQWKKVDEKEIEMSMLVNTVLGNKAIWEEDFNEITGLGEAITENLLRIEKHGVIEILKNKVEH